MALKVKGIGKTHKGLVRPGNEDYFLADDRRTVYAVCDGMGGHQAGEVASMMATEIVETAFSNFFPQIASDERLGVKRHLPDTGNVLLKSIRLANRAIRNKSAGNAALQGMGTTVVALAFEYDLLSIAHVGDSRAYHLDERKLTPLTVDHSWVTEIQQSHNISEQEAASVVGKNIITRALGVRDTVEIDFSLIRVKPGDKFILCSDGLCGYADDDEIFLAANRVRKDNEKIVDTLIQMANERGGADNVTVIVVEVVDTKDTDIPELGKFTLSSEDEATLDAENEWIDKISDFVLHRDEKRSGPTTNKALLIAIFAVFILVAAAIIYFAS